MVCKCIADILPPAKLTNTFNYVSGFYFCASVFGSAVGSLLLSNHVYILNGLSILCYIVTICVATVIPPCYGRNDSVNEAVQPFRDSSEEDLLIPTTPSMAFNPRRTSSKVPSPTDTSPCLRGCAADEIKQQHSLPQLLFRSWRASYTSLLTLFSSPNPMYTVILLLLINGLASRIGAILPQYTSLALGWPLATVNRLMALKALISAASLFALPVIRSVFLEPHFAERDGSIAIDLFITQISLIANTIGIFVLGFSAGVPLFVLGLCLYTSGAGLADSLISFGTQAIPPRESVADFYVRTGLVNAVAALIGGPLWNASMSCVIRSEWIPLGTPFWLCAGLFGMGCAGVAALKRA
ncbi:hypothetical protein MMC12_005719 [Toensbergia leucococca]|nr:hypothetical protein [Toensbergia leucococca]